jgi:Arc/MetJ family transcription regulator
MEITINLDSELLERARKLTGITDASTLVSTALEAFLSREAEKRLALLGGSQPRLSNIPPRRRFSSGPDAPAFSDKL